MRTEHVRVNVAVNRLYIYATHLSVTEKDTLTHRLMSSHPIGYTAYSWQGYRIGYTTLTPEQKPPVQTVTEESQP